MTSSEMRDVLAGVPFEFLNRASRRRLLTRSLLRAALTTITLLVVYYLLPLDARSGLGVAVDLAAGVTVLAVVLVFNVWQVVKSSYPRLRALDAAATTVPILVVVFAAIYVQVGTVQSAAFSEPLSRTDALYFTVTVLSTVGFGDITPTSMVARVVTMVQMIGDLILFAVVAKLLTSTVSEGLQRRSVDPAGDHPTSHADRGSPDVAAGS